MVRVIPLLLDLHLVCAFLSKVKQTWIDAYLPFFHYFLSKKEKDVPNVYVPEAPIRLGHPQLRL